MFEEKFLEEEQAETEGGNESEIAMQCIRRSLANLEIKPAISDIFILCTSTKCYERGSSLGFPLSQEEKEYGGIIYSDGSIGITIELHSSDTSEDIETKISEFEEIANCPIGSHLYLLNAYGQVLEDYGTYFDDMNLFRDIINMCDKDLCDRLVAVQPSDNKHEISMLRREALRRMEGEHAADYYTSQYFSTL